MLAQAWRCCQLLRTRSLHAGALLAAAALPHLTQRGRLRRRRCMRSSPRMRRGGGAEAANVTCVLVHCRTRSANAGGRRRGKCCPYDRCQTGERGILHVVPGNGLRWSIDFLTLMCACCSSRALSADRPNRAGRDADGAPVALAGSRASGVARGVLFVCGCGVWRNRASDAMQFFSAIISPPRST